MKYAVRIVFGDDADKMPRLLSVLSHPYFTCVVVVDHDNRIIFSGFEQLTTTTLHESTWRLSIEVVHSCYLTFMSGVACRCLG